MILHIPTGKLFVNRKEAKIYFGTSRYRKIEKEKKEIVLIDNHNFINVIKIMLLPLVKREYKMNWNYQKAQLKAILKS